MNFNMSAEETTPPPSEIMVIGTASIQRDAKPDELQTFIPSSSKGGIVELPLTEALKEIRQISSQAAMLLLCSHASKLETELQETKKDRNDAQQKSEKWMQAYYGEEKKSAVLRTELRAVSSKKNLQKFVGAIGGLIAGVAIPFILVESTRGWGLASSIVGIALLIVGFWPSEFQETKE
jgi:hypothetical protein